MSDIWDEVLRDEIGKDLKRATRQAANDETIRQNMPTVLKVQQERIEELETEIGELVNEVSALKMQVFEVDADAVTFKDELAALRAVAVAVAKLEAHELGVFDEFGNIPNEDLSDEYMRTLLYAAYEAMRRARRRGDE